jgi:hypothetical protein
MVKTESEQQKGTGTPPPIPDGSRTRAAIDPIILVVIAGIAVLAVVVFLVMSPSSPPVPAVSAQRCGDQTLSYVNQNLATAGTAATLDTVVELHGMYQVTVAYQGQQIPLYATTDCTLLFMESMDMAATATGSPTAAPTPAATPVMTDRPVVDLYVMSYCPYGTQAETAMKPVADLLGTKADIRVRFISSVGGTTVDSVESLHGPVEAQEDLRQACIQKYSPGKLWSYLARFNSECYSSSRTPESAVACSRNVTSAVGIDQAKIDTCAAGAEGIGLLAADEASAAAQGATASPTLLVNGVKYSGSRAPEAYKQAICGSFTTAPAECQTKLSEQQAAAGGSC